MANNVNFLRIIGKAAYLIGVLLFFNFFFGLLFFRFLPWLVFGVILLVLFSGALSLGKNILFTNLSDTQKQRPNSTNYQKGDVIDVEAQVFDSENNKEA